MAKEGDLWDDSALTNAFDQAMSKYKKMHIKGYEGSSTGFGEAKGKEITVDAPSSVEIDCGTSSQTLKAAEGNADHLPFAKENESMDFQVPQEHVEVPNGVPLQGHAQTYLGSEGMDEYDLLCKQYYELEEKRVQIWEKLQQYGHSDYNYPVGNSGSCMQWPTNSASQNQYYSSQACYPALAIACCSATSCTLPTCSLGDFAPCTNSSLTIGNERMTEDTDIVKKGMEAAQKAISMLKEEASDSPLEVRSCRQKEANTKGETDLTEVLNAWYSAGFYTGKYLTEKSLAKPRSDPKSFAEG